ncbi:MAG: hypothetical protein PW843_19430 [Azospirillaceae bacterium]|nr:hypothetical protein [Azospirillaceae bacterium]
MSVLHLHLAPRAAGRPGAAATRQPACTWLLLASVLAFALVLAAWLAEMVTVFPIGILIGTAALAVAACVERVRYKPLLTALPGPGWHDTGERFTDPATGFAVAVYFNAARMERCYVRLGPPA